MAANSGDVVIDHKAKVRFSFDDVWFGTSEVDARSLTNRMIKRPPGIERNADWYEFAGQMAKLLNEQAEAIEAMTRANDKAQYSLPKDISSSGGEYTVIGHNESSRELFIEHVEANDGLHAFAVAAARQPEAEFSAAVAGRLVEADGAIVLPGEGLVCTATIESQPDVFGDIPEDGTSPKGP